MFTSLRTERDIRAQYQSL